MSDRFDIPAGEHGVVRIFEVTLDDPAKQRALLTGKEDATWPLEQALGAKGLDRSYVDVIEAGALEGVGLVRYLRDGLGVADSELDGLQPRLDAIEGPVVVVLSRAFEGREATIATEGSLAWVATLREPGAAPVFQDSRPADGRMEQTASPAPAGRPGSGLVIALVLLGAIAVGTALVVFFIGALGER